ncbi:MAG TPA: sugar nucleotide-binding protein, partial [Patescibacteria group bacterium]|nr:sugar nucleotide-binding protein [Patescibacteria group bacterium]
MTKILILGSAGMLGNALVKEFSNDYEVVGWDRAEIDITNEAEVQEKIHALKPRLIINATGHNGVDLTETNGEVHELAKKINGTAVGKLAHIAGNLSVPLVHYSTDYVFDGMSAAGYAEDAIPNPL